jgi:hypothetical protein
MLTSIAVVLTGVWLIIDSQSTLSTTATLIFGIVIAALAAIELIQPYARR